jgi:hypothetical protein
MLTLIQNVEEEQKSQTEVSRRSRGRFTGGESDVLKAKDNEVLQCVISPFCSSAFCLIFISVSS